MQLTGRSISLVLALYREPSVWNQLSGDCRVTNTSFHSLANSSSIQSRVHLLDARRELRFGLLKQRLLELVRRGETDEALAFAVERLAPEGARDPAMLRQIEEAITLLAFKVSWQLAPAKPSRF